MIEPIKVEADPPEAIGVAQAHRPTSNRSASSTRTPPDLKQFGLAEPPITVEFKAEGGASGSFKLGNKNATQGEIYALKDGEKRCSWCRRSRNPASTASRSTCATRRS